MIFLARPFYELCSTLDWVRITVHGPSGLTCSVSLLGFMCSCCSWYCSLGWFQCWVTGWEMTGRSLLERILGELGQVIVGIGTFFSFKLWSLIRRRFLCLDVTIFLVF